MNPPPLRLEMAMKALGKDYDITQPGALISTYNKHGIDRMVKAIHDSGRTIYSTGGTGEHIEKLNIPFIQVSDLTDFPEILGGRVKTLHPNVFGGILGRTNVLGDIKDLQEHRIPLIDIVVVDLYPFRNEVMKGDGTTYEQIVEKIDIGGIALLRAAAKNHERVSVIAAPSGYDELAEMLENKTEITLKQRKIWATDAFRIVTNYDIDIYEWMNTGKVPMLAP